MPFIENSGGGSGGGSGTVTQVSSANAAIAVATGTTTPVLTAGTLDVIAAQGPPAANVAMNAKKITGLAAATAATDAASLANTLDLFGAPAANVAWNAKKITGLANGSAAQDAAAFGQLPTFFVPLSGSGYISAAYYSGGLVFPTAAGTAVTNGTAYAIPFFNRATATFVRISVFQTAAGAASSVVRLGIYNDTGNLYPGTVLLDAGTYDSSTGTSVTKEITISQALVANTVYWLVAAPQVAAGPSLLAASTNTGTQFWQGYTGGVQANALGFSMTGVSGALPTFSGTVTSIASGAPQIWLRNT